MKIQEWISQDLAEISTILERIDLERADKLMNELLEAERIFVMGMGRSGLVLEMFAMRMTQLGRRMLVIGASTTPAISQDDLLLLATASASRPYMIQAVKTARRQHAKIALITSSDGSELAQLVDSELVLPRNTTQDDVKDPLPLGTAFEQSLLVFLDSMVSLMAQELGITEDSMAERHANIE